MFNLFRNKYIVIGSAVVTCYTGAGFLKTQMQGSKFENPIRADDKVMIVTGANTGIGLETTRELAKRGAKVYMACRNIQKCEEAREKVVLETRNKYVYCRECDLSSMESIREFARKFKAEQGRLDVLINNAGVMRCPRTVTKDGIEMQLGVNHLGHFLLTNLLLDHLKKSTPSRIVVVSSIAHTRGEINTTDLNSEKSYDEGHAYNQSKLANVLFMKELARRLKDTGVTVNALHPGIVNTEIVRHMSVSTGITGFILRIVMWPFVKTPVSGAQTTLYAALDPELEKVTGKYFSDCAEKETAEQTDDDIMADWLWRVSERWTGVSAT